MRQEHSLQPPPLREDALEQGVDVFMGMANHHERHCNLLDNPHLDHPRKESDHPPVLVVRGIVNLPAAMVQGE
eukprot:4695023-Pleurochrysis_carterae.AAC.2